MSQPDLENRRRRSLSRVTTVFGVGIVVAVRAGTRMLSAAAMTETARHLHRVQLLGGQLLGTQDVSLTKSSGSPAAATGDDAIDPVGTTAWVLNNHERERFDMWVGDETGRCARLPRRTRHRRVARRPTDESSRSCTPWWRRNGPGKDSARSFVREAFAHARSREWTVRLACLYAQNILTQRSRGSRI